MSDLILVAAGGLACETLAALRAEGTHDVIGFADDDASRWGTTFDGVKVIGGLDAVAANPQAQVVICAGKGSVRAAIADRLALDEDRYTTVVHPSVGVPESCALGVGSVIFAGCVLTASVTVGRHVVLMPNVVLTHDDVVEDFATLCAGVVLGGSVRVGTGAYLGMAASVREGRTIGGNALIGMGSVVLADVPDGETWFGVPARPRAVPS